MAEASSLQENLSCCICFNIYRNPHRLACMHMLCLECIDKLQTHEGVTCPECRQVCDRTQVKKDFKTQEIIDVLNERAQVCEHIQNAVLQKCDVCEESGRPITCKCTECNQDMCSGCEKAHRGSKASKNHSVISIQQITGTTRENLKKTLQTLEKQKQDNSLKSKTLKDKVQEFNKDKEQQLSSLREYEEELIQDIKKHCTEMGQKISEANDCIIDTCSVIQKLYDNNDRELKSHIETINDLLNTKDTTTLLKSPEMVDSEIQQNIVEIEKKISQVKTPVRFPVTVERGENWHCNTGPQVKVNDDVYGRRAIVTLKHWAGIPLMLQNTYRWGSNIQLDKCPRRMCFVNDTIWTVDHGANIKTYDYNLQHINTVNVNDAVWGITYDRDNDQVITAHRDDKGLHQYDLQGCHIHQICTGYYADVITHDSKLYALSNRPSSSLHVFTYSDNQWHKHCQVPLCYNGGNADTMCIIGDCIHVSSWNNDCIYTFSLESGQLQHTAGKQRRTGSPGELYRPLISGCHGDTGDILVADRRNDRLQVYSSTDDQWSVVRLEGKKLQWPQQALVDQHADNIWVIAGYSSKPGSCKLIKYTKSQ